MSGVRAWAHERFPLTLVAVLLPAYAVAVLYGRSVTGRPPPGPAEAAAFVGVWAFFLLVRVVDEHKDFARDRVDHPDRVLQRGAVTLDHLKVVGVAAVLVQIVVVAATGTWTWWLVTMAWAALAARDFFLGAVVTDRPVLHVLLHLPLSALVCLWMAQVGANGGRLPATAFAVGALGIAVAATVDLVRKLVPEGGAGRGYDAALGTRGAAVAATVAVVFTTGVLASLILLGHGRVPALLAVTALAAVPLALLGRYAVTGVAGPARIALAVVVPVQLAACAAALWRWSG